MGSSHSKSKHPTHTHAHSHHTHQTFTQKLEHEGEAIAKTISYDVGEAVGTVTAMIIQANIKFAVDAAKAVFKALHMSAQFRDIIAMIESPLTYVIAGIVAGIVII